MWSVFLVFLGVLQQGFPTDETNIRFILKKLSEAQAGTQ